MAVFRIFPSKDSWITNRLDPYSTTIRGTGSNHGLSPSLNVFAVEPAQLSGTNDLARTLMQFDLTELSGKIYSDQIIPSSSVTYILKMFDMKHEDTIPTSCDLFVYPVSASWDEGTGIDDDLDRDTGFVNWYQPTSTTSWTLSGSDFLTASYGSGSQRLNSGREDLEVTISDMVVNWLTGSLTNNGLVVKLGVPEESNSTDYFRKAFHGRETKYIDRLPYIEARWNDSLKDNRNNFAYDQSSNLVLYNFVRGELTNLTEPITVRVRDHVDLVSASYSQDFTAVKIATGIYSASLNVVNTASFSSSWSDVWFSGSRVYMSGAFSPLILTGSQTDQYDEFTVNVSNLNRVYGVNEEARVKVNVRKRDFVTHRGVIHTASLAVEREYIEKMYYSITNDETGEMVVPFGTGSLSHTQLSYDGDGNYFNLWMSSFVPGFTYRLKFLIDINRYDKKVIDDGFVFKVV